MKKGFRALLDEANAEIEVVSPEEAAELLDDEDTVFVDLRDPREVRARRQDRRAHHCHPRHAGILDRPGKPLPQAVLRLGKELHLLLRRRLALGTRHQDRAGHGAFAGQAYPRRLHRLESGWPADEPGEQSRNELGQVRRPAPAAAARPGTTPPARTTPLVGENAAMAEPFRPMQPDMVAGARIHASRGRPTPRDRRAHG